MEQELLALYYSIPTEDVHRRLSNLSGRQPLSADEVYRVSLHLTGNKDIAERNRATAIARAKPNDD